MESPMPDKGVESGPATVRVAVYRRGGTDNARLDALMASHPDWTVVREFSEPPNTTSNDTDRPGSQKAMRWTKSGRIDLLLVEQTAVLTRELDVLDDLLGDLERAGVAFRSVADGFDTSTPASRMMRQLLKAFVQFERATQAREAARG